MSRATPPRFGVGTPWERAALSVGLITLFLVGYFGVGLTTDPTQARDMATQFDNRIPFVAETVWVYIGLFPAALLPLFTVRCRRLFRRLSVAYAVVIGLSLFCFVAWPVTSLGLRVDPASLDTRHSSQWCVKLLYTLDPPYNLFPSLHVSIATVAALAAGKARRVYGAVAAAGVGLILVSLTTVKQHFVLDGIGGLVLGLLTYAAVLRPYQRLHDGSSAFSWGGPAAFLAFVLLVYVGLFVAFTRFS